MRLLPVTFSILGLVAAGIVWPQSNPAHVEQQRQMTRLHVADLVESWLEATGVPGAALAVVSGSHLLMLEGFGHADSESSLAVDPHTTIFRAGSLVRAMTASAALLMTERGALDLETDLSHQPGLEILVDDSLGPLTLAQLLLHTAGIDQRRVATRARTPSDLVSLETYLDRRLPPRVRPAGVVSIPSSHGYAVIGRLMEQISSMSFESHLETTLLAPLGMSNTALSDATLPAAQIATGHRWSQGGWTAISPDYPQTVPASTLSTTAADMARWMRVVLGDGSLEGRQILATTSIARLLERQVTHHESLPGRTLAFQEGRHLSPRELYLDSTDNGFSAVLVLLPATRVGLFAAFNSDIDVWELVYQILDPFDSPGGLEDDASEVGEAWIGKEPTGFWQDAAVSRATAEKLLSLVRQDRIRRTADGALVWRSRTFAPAASPCFQERETLARLCFFDGPGQVHFATSGDLVLEKLEWYAARPVQIALWVGFAALFLAAGWPRVAPPRSHHALRPDNTVSPRWPESLARFAATLHFVFIASLAIFLATALRTGSTTLLYEVPLFLFLFLSLPPIAAGLTLGAAVGLGPLWRTSRSSLGYRLRVTLLVLALVAYLPFLRSWNLLGFHI